MEKRFNTTQPIFTPGVSRTRPGLAMSVRKIQEHFVKGKPVPQAKAPIHEPKLDNLQNPMRRPYCDLVDVAAYNEILTERLNESESLLTDKKKEFLREMKEYNNQSKSSLIEDLKKSISTS